MTPTEPEIKAWVNDNLSRKLDEFGLGYWRVQVSYVRHETREDGFKAAMQVESVFEYERSMVRIDTDEYGDENGLERLEKDLEHEIMHIVHSPFLLLADLAHEILDGDAWAMWHIAWHRAQEMTVRNMERMTQGLRESASAKAVKEADEARAKLAIGG